MVKDYMAGLVLDDASLEWTVLQQAKDRLQVVASRHASLAPDTAAPEAGQPAPETRAARIRAECVGLRGRVALGLPTGQILLRVVSLPTIDEAEMAGMAELQVDEFSPFPIESLVVTHEVLVKKPDGALVLLAAAREESVDTQGGVLRAAGIIPSKVDATVLGWWRLLHDAGEIHAKGRQLLVLLHGGPPEIIVAEDGAPVLFRSLVGTEGLPENDAAVEIAHEVGYTLMSLELERGSVAAPSIVVWHAAGREPGVCVTRLREEFAHPVEVKMLSALPSVSEGLARRMADGGGLDLTPRTWRDSSASRAFRRRMIASAAAVFGLWLVMAAGMMGGLSYQNIRLARLEFEAQKVHGPAKEVREMQRRVEMVQRYMNRNDSAIECLREISERMPDGIELSSFTYRKGDSVKMLGLGQAVSQVYAFKSALDTSTIFRGTTLKEVKVRDTKQSFGLDLKLPGGGAE